MFNLFILALLFVTLVSTLLFWKKNQNMVYSVLILCIIFLSGATIFKEFNQEWKDYQKEYYHLLSEHEPDPAKKSVILNTPLKIQQIWNYDLNTTDRCTSCHMGINNPAMKDAQPPFSYHTNLREHDFEDIGCVICHQGQGMATTAEDAHAKHDKFWETPLLPLNLVQSACNKCHPDQIELKGGDLFSRGKALFSRRGCPGCHKMKGFEQYYNIATSLRKAGNKMRPDWLVQWLVDPVTNQPNSRMPDFRLTENEAVSIVAFLMDQSDKNYVEPIKYDNGDSNTGKKLFKTVGCMACHKLQSEGSDFASDLSNVGRKVTPSWILNWILNPNGYDANTIMPNFRLSIQQAKDITAFLITFAPEKTIPGFKEKISSPEIIKQGLALVKNKGCSGCHEINGISPSKIGPELSKIGAKSGHDLDFGNAKGIEHTWAGWTKNKLKNPAVYNTETIKATMPTFSMSDDDITALMVFLKGMDGSTVPVEFMRKLSTREFEIEQGRKIINKYNCRSCHIISDKGGDIAKYYKGKFVAPPPLEAGSLHVGERLKDSWLYSFLRKPTRVREWLKVVMPTFSFSHDEIYYIYRYFINFGEKEEIATTETLPASDDYLKEGRMLVLAFDCEDCHDGTRGPTFDIISDRIQEKWAKKWLKDTQSLYPGTKMPNHWPKRDGRYKVASRYGIAKELMGGDVDKQINAIWEYLESYKQKPFLDLKLPEDEDEEDE